jgi:signal transduction histidine kinase
MTDGQGVQASQSRLRALLRANLAVIEHIDLAVLLQRIIESAVELVGARYGALGVIAADGSLEQFIHVGMPADLAAQIGHLPEGHGLLGALIDDPHAIRIPDLSLDERSVGFPAYHPPMKAFLGVPIRVRDEVYGNLYLSNEDSAEFSDEDEQLVNALAATAGIAIENARLFAETHRRQSWAAASAEITAALLSSDDADVISTIATRVLSLADADVVWLLKSTTDPEFMIVDTARGVDEPTVQGTLLPVAGSLSASVLEAGQPRLVDDSAEYGLSLSGERSLGPMMAVPLVSAGVLLVGRLQGSPRFSRSDLEMAADFAGQASVAMELAAARRSRERVALLEDRGRIARDLHDHVIQQLFATGLDLQSVAGATTPELADRIAASVVDIDTSISHIRTVVFALSATPNVSFSGPVDLVITDQLADDVVAVVREALMNVVKHAAAETSSVELVVTDDEVRLRVTDDGRGAQGATRRSGVSNLEQRALRRGGSLAFESDSTGTRLTWIVPIGESA